HERSPARRYSTIRGLSDVAVRQATVKLRLGSPSQVTWTWEAQPLSSPTVHRICCLQIRSKPVRYSARIPAAEASAKPPPIPASHGRKRARRGAPGVRWSATFRVCHGGRTNGEGTFGYAAPGWWTHSCIAFRGGCTPTPSPVS